MVALTRVAMSGGKTNKEDRENGTQQIRVNGDLAEMISWIIEIEGGTTARLLDPMIRPQIIARFARYGEEINELKKAKEALLLAKQKVKEKLEQRELEEKPKKKRAE